MMIKRRYEIPNDSRNNNPKSVEFSDSIDVGVFLIDISRFACSYTGVSK